MKPLSLDKIESGFKWLQSECEDVEVIQSIDMLIEKLNNINATLSWCNEQMAIAKFNYNEAKVKAYNKLQFNNEAHGKTKFSPLLAKDYVSAQCNQQAFEYDLTERFSRSLVHISDNIRTCISALKVQLQLDMQSERIPKNY